jgi:hypothetical protein
VRERADRLTVRATVTKATEQDVLDPDGLRLSTAPVPATGELVFKDSPPGGWFTIANAIFTAR